MISVRVPLHRYIPIWAWAPLLRHLAVFVSEQSLFAFISRKSELLSDAIIPPMLLLEASLIATTGAEGIAHSVALVVPISSI